MAQIPPRPPWLTDHSESPPAPKPRGRPFQPGQSGNPAGRPLGSKNKKTLLAEELEQAGSAVQAVVIAKALEGDMQAASLVMTRVHAPLRSRAPTVEFDFDPNGSPSEMSSQILLAVSRGQLDPDTGKMLLDCVAAHIGMRDVETFADELRRVESKQMNRIRGGVLVQ